MILKVAPNGAVTQHEYPRGALTKQNEKFRELIGDGCDLYEVVSPVYLYSVFGYKRYVTDTPGEAVCMLVDEEGLLKSLPVNRIATYLYTSYDQEGVSFPPIVGTALFVGLCHKDDELTFCDLAPDVAAKLYRDLRTLRYKIIKVI